VNPNLAQETNGYQRSVNQSPSLLPFRQELIRVHLVARNSTVLQDTWEFSESKEIYRLIGLSIVKYRAVVPNFFLLPHYPNAQRLPSAMYPITYKDFQMGPKNTSIPPSTNGHMKNGEEQVQYKKSPPRDLIHLLADTQPHLPGSLTPLSLFKIK